MAIAGSGQDHVINAGYGSFWDGKKHVLAHRYSYLLARGELPTYIDHTCHDRACVNPDHLRPVTNKQNIENRHGANKNSGTGIRGVSWDRSRGKWVSQVHHHGQTFPIGRFDNLADAQAAVIAKRLELFTHSDGR